jgi:hypothetical protein
MNKTSKNAQNNNDVKATSSSDSEQATLFKCNRCDYLSLNKFDLVQHLKRKNPCRAKYSNEPASSQLDSMMNKRKVIPCPHCSKTFTTIQGRCYHLKHHCKEKVTTSTHTDQDDHNALRIKVEQMEERINNIMDTMEKWKIEIMDEIQGSKKEEFFQRHFEKVYGGKHHSNTFGVTDITTEEAHIEIKEWKKWKYAMGQILSYNHDNAKKMIVLLFGKYNNNEKNKVASHLNNHGIEVKDVQWTPFGVVTTDLPSENIPIL